VKVEATVVNEFEAMKDEIGNIAFNVDTLPLPDYIEKWRVLLWEKAFLTIMRGNPSFIKSTQLTKMPKGDSVIKRVLYRLNTMM
jgi:hypothetical protein